MAAGRGRLPLLLLAAVVIAADFVSAAPYFGKKLGSLKTYHHGAAGDVYAVDSKTIHIKGFSYDGQGPDAFFWAGTSAKPNDAGFIVLNDKGTKDVLKAYTNQDITITLPEGKTLDDIKWLSVWCRTFSANFADIFIPANFAYPKAQRLDRIVGVMHNTSSGPVVAVDAQTFMVPNFYTDGQAPDAHFWAGRGKPSQNGVLVPDENGSSKPLGRYDGQSLVISLPNDMTVFDIDYLSVWCREFAVDFGHVKIPKDLNVPPSLKMVGVSPQSKLNCEVLSDGIGFEVRWAKAGDTVVVQLVAHLADGEYMSFGLSGDAKHSQMVDGDVVVAWIDKFNHGHAVDYFLDAKSQCANGRGSCPDYKIQSHTNTVRLLNAVKVNGYVMVTYQRPLAAVDRLDIAIADNDAQPIIWAIGPLNSQDEVSYHSSRNGDDVFIDFNRVPTWNCPDPITESASSESDSGSQASAPGASTTDVHLTPPQRPSSGGSSGNKRPSQSTSGGSSSGAAPSSSGSANRGSSGSSSSSSSAGGNAPSRRPQAAASGQQPSSTKTKETAVVDQPAPSVPADDAWYIPPIECPEPQDNVFYAQIGPAGGKKGYSTITGHVGWGIGWYINGLLIPEITVVRGKTYTFVVEGGNDPEAPARNHPFYITDDPVGGFGAKSAADQEKVRVFAGIRFGANGEAEATAAGRLCEWVQKSKESAEKYNSFGEYQRVLELSCDKGQAAVLQWTPDAETPDLVFYQCFTHRYLGWKIHVVDQCEFDHEFGSSFVHETNLTGQSSNARNQQLSSYARSMPDSKYVSGDDMIASVVSTKIGVDSSASISFGRNPQVMDGFRPVATAARGSQPESRPLVAVHRPPVPLMPNGSFVKDPFVPNRAVPFQPSFQPGEPQFGGFGASDFGQRFEKAPPVYVSERLVPHSPIVPNLPSRLGNVYQPTSEFRSRPRDESFAKFEESAQHPVVFRAPSTSRDGIPPVPPQLPPPQRPANSGFIRHRVQQSDESDRRHPVGSDGTPVRSGAPPSPHLANPRLALGNVARPTKTFRPFKGTTPPPVPALVPQLPQFTSTLNRRPADAQPLIAENKRIGPPRNAVRISQASAAANSSTSADNDYTILTNIWSIINQEKVGDQQQSAKVAQRKVRSAAEATKEGVTVAPTSGDSPKAEPTSEPAAEPSAEPAAEPAAEPTPEPESTADAKHGRSGGEEEVNGSPSEVKEQAVKSGVSSVGYCSSLWIVFGLVAVNKLLFY